MSASKVVVCSPLVVFKHIARLMWRSMYRIRIDDCVLLVTRGLCEPPECEPPIGFHIELLFGEQSVHVSHQDGDPDNVYFVCSNQIGGDVRLPNWETETKFSGTRAQVCTEFIRAFSKWFKENHYADAVAETEAFLTRATAVDKRTRGRWGTKDWMELEAAERELDARFYRRRR